MPLITSGNTVSSTAQIVDGIITNADVSPTAAIAISKLSGVAASGANSDITSLTALSTPLSVAQGGTGAATLTAKGVLYGDGTSAIGATAVGTAGQALVSNGAGNAPTFQTVPAFTTVKVGSGTKDTSDASTTQNIAHGLGATPKFVRLVYMSDEASSNIYGKVMVIYDGTTKAVVGKMVCGGAITDLTGTDFFLPQGSNPALRQTGVISFDSTNIIIVWTKANTPTNLWKYTWEAWV